MSTSGLTTKTQYDLNKQGLEKKIEYIHKKICKLANQKDRLPHKSYLDWKQDT